MTSLRTKRRTVMTTTELQRTSKALGTTAYRAAVAHDFAQPLRVEDVPRGPLEPGQIRVRIEASGLCHTDIHAAHGDWPVKPSPPFVPGHEGVGIVDELGPGVVEVQVGDRVALPWLGYACGTARRASSKSTVARSSRCASRTPSAASSSSPLDGRVGPAYD
jgi:D-arabinose 1-dehydrogenase-like Zn-dependent alcohol dehydrogenase